MSLLDAFETSLSVAIKQDESVAFGRGEFSPYDLRMLLQHIKAGRQSLEYLGMLERIIANNPNVEFDNATLLRQMGFITCKDVIR